MSRTLKIRKIIGKSDGKLLTNGSEIRIMSVKSIPVAMAKGSHLFPYRTQKLSLSAPMVLGWRRPGRVGRCRIPDRRRPTVLGVFFLCFWANLGENERMKRKIEAEERKVELTSIFLRWYNNFLSHSRQLKKGQHRRPTWQDRTTITTRRKQKCETKESGHNGQLISGIRGELQRGRRDRHDHGRAHLQDI